MPATSNRRPGVAGRLAPLLEQAFAGPLPIRLRAWDGSETGADDAPVVVLRSRRALRRLLWAPGELGLAQAYVTGDIDVEGDLTDAFRRIWATVRSRRIGAPSLRAGDFARAGLLAARLGAIGPRPKPPAAQAQLSGALHSRRRDRAAISHHYDLSNEFYGLILDEHMAYSCAYWTSADPGYTLHDAQTDKLDLVCRKLGLEPGMRFLDVGCGWGSLILYAAEHYGVSATGVTLSAQQRELVERRIAERGLAERVEVRLQDYREVDDGPYDRIASLEMGEHVGAENYPTYTANLFRLLKPQGRLLLQQMSHAENASGGGAFIESYVAPDMHMRPPAQTLALIEAAGFEVRDVEAMREHYVRTVEVWLDTLEQRWNEVVALVGEEVARVWRLYLVGGALTFEERRMGVDQFLAVKPTAEGVSGMPWTREWLAPAASVRPAVAAVRP